MKRGVLPVFLLALFLSFGIVSAVDTEITVQTLPEHSVDIYILQPDEEYSLIKDFHVSSNKSGVASATFSSDVSEFEVKVLVRKGNTQIVNERFNDTFSAGESVSLELYPEWYITQKEIEAQRLTASSNSTNNSAEILADTNATENNSAENETEEANISESDGKTFSFGGFAIFGEGGFLSKKVIYYSIGSIVSLVVLFLVILQVMKMIRKKKDMERYGYVREDSNAELRDAERKIKEAQEEIAKVKGKNSLTEKEKRIMDVKKKLAEDQKELMRLKD